MIHSYTVFDIETSGLSPVYDRIIEIAAIKIRDGEQVDSFVTLVDPGRKLEDKIVSLTGITSDMLMGQPDIETVLPDFLDFIGDDIIMGHNILFDYSFIKQEALRQKLPQGKETERLCVDTLKIARKCLPELESRKLDDLCTFFEIKDENHHRAMNDVNVTLQLYCKLCKRFETEDIKFKPEPIFYKPKKVRMATENQKEFLRSLAQHHGISLDVDPDKMTQNEVNRYTDQIISKYGRLK